MEGNLDDNIMQSRRCQSLAPTPLVALGQSSVRYYDAAKAIDERFEEGFPMHASFIWHVLNRDTHNATSVLDHDTLSRSSTFRTTGIRTYAC